VKPEDFDAARRAGLIDDAGKLTHAGRVLVGEDRSSPPELEPLEQWTRRWLARRGPMRTHVEPNMQPRLADGSIARPKLRLVKG
jgi:hypothetical protein